MGAPRARNPALASANRAARASVPRPGCSIATLGARLSPCAPAIRTVLPDVATTLRYGAITREPHVSRICRDEGSYYINPPHRAKRTGKRQEKFFRRVRFQNRNEVRCNELRRAATVCPATKSA